MDRAVHDPSRNRTDVSGDEPRGGGTGDQLIVGGSHLGRRLAERLHENGKTVTFLAEDPNTVERALAAGLNAERIDITDLQSLRGVGLDHAETAIVASDSDSGNILTAQLIATAFDIERIIARVNDPRNHSAFDDVDTETVCTTDVLATAFVETAQLSNEGL